MAVASDTALAPAPTSLNDRYTLWSWLSTTDHKRIGILYLISVTGFFFLGGFAAMLIRIELLTPAGDFLTADGYNRAFTLHGTVMVWFFLIPSIPNTLGNFLIPLMIGAKDLAFPRLNLASWYIFMAGGALAVWSLIAGGVDTGWTFYTPYSTFYSNSHVLSMAAGIFISGFASILTGLNFIVTIHKLRAPGMTWFRLPLFVWSHYATSVILVLATPVLAAVLLLMFVERAFHLGVFDPGLGGDPLLFQHLFWFYSHPAVYIMVLPGMGVTSELVAAFCRKRVFGYQYVAFASIAIASVGFLVWGHHMFVSGQSLYASTVFSFLSFVVAVPSAVKVYNWTATFYKANIVFAAPLYYAIGFIALFVIGGVTGLMLASLAIDAHVTDTYFVVAHFHFIMVGATVLAYLGGLHYWWPKITGRMYPKVLANFSAVLIFLGFLMTFTPQYVLGYLGMPRRYWTYPPEYQTLNVLSSAGASILAVGYIFPLLYLFWSLRYGPPAGSNPWNAVGLEWTTPSPPPKENFAETPHVTWEAYDYPSE